MPTIPRKIWGESALVTRKAPNRLTAVLENHILVSEATAEEIQLAYCLIKKAHYQRSNASGRVLVARLSDQGWDMIPPALRSRIPSGLVGAAIVGRGCTRGKPLGRLHLAQKHFPRLDLQRLPRDVTVERIGLAMIHRVAVVSEFRDSGVGTRLAYECRKIARVGEKPARFVEVITTRRRDEADAILKGNATQRDFLQRAGFFLAPEWTGRGRRMLNPRFRKLEDTVRLYYWAPTIRDDNAES